MTSLLVSAAQQETLMASPSSCSEKVLPFFFFPSLPLQSSGLRPSFRSGLGSPPVLAQGPHCCCLLAGATNSLPIALLWWRCQKYKRFNFFFFFPLGEVTEKRIQLCGNGLLHRACYWIQLSCKDQDGQVMICLGETTSLA